MSESQEFYGELNEDGSIKSEPSLFISSGRSYMPGMASVREKVSGTSWFYRLEAGSEPTDEQRQAWREGVPSQDRRLPVLPQRRIAQEDKEST